MGLRGKSAFRLRASRIRPYRAAPSPPPGGGGGVSADRLRRCSFKRYGKTNFPPDLPRIRFGKPSSASPTMQSLTCDAGEPGVTPEEGQVQSGPSGARRASRASSRDEIHRHEHRRPSQCVLHTSCSHYNHGRPPPPGPPPIPPTPLVCPCSNLELCSTGLQSMRDHM